MKRQTSKGKCNFCQGIFSKAAMTKHLKSCNQGKTVFKATSHKKRSQKAKALRLAVEGLDMPMYWMHLEAGANVTLENLDDFLRDVWLEC